MKLIALTINGTPVPVPSTVANLSITKQGAFGQNIFQTFITFLMLFAVLAAFAFIVYAGYKFIFSQGSKQEFDNARKTIQYAVLGLMIVFISILIIQIISYFLKAPILTK
ncbi:MAG: hypothetical protein ACREGI_01115 [Candidatus Levyibacteriota bacterium]